MEPTTSSRKRPLDGGGGGDSPPHTEKRVRFPKGKKPRRGGGDERRAVTEVEDDGPVPWAADAALAARERAKRRSRKIEEDVLGEHHRFEDFVARSEVNYEENASFDDDGIQIEPFNLCNEREEGYFDESGNYVEYVRTNEIKDAWLDNVDAEVKFVEQKSFANSEIEEEEGYQDLTTAEIGKIKGHIADVLQPGETVMQALRRLKGTSGDKKHKMSEDTKHLFDQLTENAMKLMENGEYNVYHEERETFEREAEGYERLILAKGRSSNGDNQSEVQQPASLQGEGLQGSHTSILDTVFAPAEANSTQISSGDAGGEFDMFGDAGGEFDMFGDDDDNEEKASADLIRNANSDGGNVGIENDYVFDDSTGYYYSSSSGYYYDPGSGLYCSALSGKWYSFNEQTGSYDEIESQATEPASASITD